MRGPFEWFENKCFNYVHQGLKFFILLDSLLIKESSEGRVYMITYFCCRSLAVKKPLILKIVIPAPNQGRKECNIGGLYFFYMLST